jgi:hypothetical protein
MLKFDAPKTAGALDVRMQEVMVEEERIQAPTFSYVLGQAT